jgi:hypothetical protein
MNFSRPGLLRQFEPELIPGTQHPVVQETSPLSQRISSSSIRYELPRPKCRRRSLRKKLPPLG